MTNKHQIAFTEFKTSNSKPKKEINNKNQQPKIYNQKPNNNNKKTKKVKTKNKQQQKDKKTTTTMKPKINNHVLQKKNKELYIKTEINIQLSVTNNLQPQPSSKVHQQPTTNTQMLLKK